VRTERNASLKPYNTFGLDVTAERLYHLESEMDLVEYLDDPRGYAQHALLLGGGSNMLLAGNIKGSVARVAWTGRRVVEEGDGFVVVEAAAARVERTTIAAVPDGITVELEQVGNRPGGSNAPDEPLVELARAARAALGLGVAEEHLASTDANAGLARGIPAIGMGITRGDHAHRTDEWIAEAPSALGVGALLGLVRTAT
jgi:acetylornithine deacetylase/succinyl-diaminopimelate desuccinylase-like protein